MEEKAENRAFTLSEILITMVIVGVVATMTIPNVVDNISLAQYKSAWKKEYSSISNAHSLIKLNNGGTMNGIATSDDTLMAAFLEYMPAIEVCTAASAGCWYPDNPTYIKDIDGSNKWSRTTFGRAILKDGSLLFINWDFTNCADSTVASGSISRCGWGLIDVNGYKGPNRGGKDTYAFWIGERVVPNGSLDDTYVDQCSDSQGFGCSAKYLYE